jgi:hypothetical protein
MKHRHLLRSFLSTALLLSIGAVALAQTPARVRGTVKSLDGNVLTVTSRDGKDVQVTLAPNWRAIAVLPAKMDQIKPGTFIGTAASGPENDQRALEVVVFPEAMRGTGEGHYGWDLQPGSSMTNGNVDGEVSAANGRQLTVSYKGGSTKITVPPDVPVVEVTPADKSIVVPGAKVFVPGRREASGGIEAGAVLVGKEGITPPM